MELIIGNLPDVQDETEQSMLRARVSTAVCDMLAERYHIQRPQVPIREHKSAAQGPQGAKAAGHAANRPDGDSDDAEAVPAINVQDPQFSFDQLVLEDSVVEELQYAIKFESVRDKVYNEWGLKKIDPAPKLALNFHGESGTGKTMAAQAFAHVMGKKIILASYAEIESKYHGDGPKNVKKLFQFALDNDAVLFIDEADSLLSRRLTNVTQGSEQAINSMRSQLLIEIEKFSGIVVFATNLAVNYDSAFVTRIKSIYFKKPDSGMRQKLWQKMLLPTLPLEEGIDMAQLAEIDEVCGRDIKNAVIKAATVSAINGEAVITQAILEKSLQDIITANAQVSKTKHGASLSTEEKAAVTEKIKEKLKEKEEVENAS
jgi:ATP-dependent 26S proteasome regulatory subunit